MSESTRRARALNSDGDYEVACIQYCYYMHLAVWRLVFPEVYSQRIWEVNVDDEWTPTEWMPVP
jgi:hypothetical protein